jgi:hypothetical protein
MEARHTRNVGIKTMNFQQLPAIVKRQMSTAALPPNYERAKDALAECARLDECKEWINRMAAMASYARQAKDMAMEELSLRIRRRAERRLGELLAEIPSSRSKGEQINPRKIAANNIGVSAPLASQLVRVSTVPKPTFDQKVDQSPVPTLRQLDPGWTASLASKKSGVDREALSAYAEIQSALAPMARLVLEKQASAALMAKQIRWAGLPEEYLEGLKHTAAIVSEWLDEFERRLRK